MSKPKILFVGESWFVYTTEYKGFDQFTIGGYETEIEKVRAYMEPSAEITHMPAHEVLEGFPTTLEELNKYDLVIISDVGANTFYLHPNTFKFSERTPNRIHLLAEYVEQGGALGMIGGYMTFTGIEAKAKYHGSAIEKVLPVDFLPYDDREEHPEGIVCSTVEGHDLLKDVNGEWPAMLGYNKAVAKAEADVIATYKGDPILATMEYGKGRTFTWSSDCAPHWLPMEFCQWEGNKNLWRNIINWCVKK